MKIYKVELIRENLNGWNSSQYVKAEKYCLTPEKATSWLYKWGKDYEQYNKENFWSDEYDSYGSRYVTHLKEIEVEEE